MRHILGKGLQLPCCCPGRASRLRCRRGTRQSPVEFGWGDRAQSPRRLKQLEGSCQRPREEWVPQRSAESPPQNSRELPRAHRWGSYQRWGKNCPKRVESGAHSLSGWNKASLSARVGNLVTHGAWSRVHSSLLPYQWGQFSLNWAQPQSWLTRKTQIVSKYINSVPVQS